MVRTKVPDASTDLARQVTAFVQELRNEDLYKVPGVAESIDWVSALVALDREALDESIVEDTLGVILKYQDDVEHLKGRALQQVYNRAKSVA